MTTIGILSFVEDFLIDEVHLNLTHSYSHGIHYRIENPTCVMLYHGFFYILKHLMFTQGKQYFNILSKIGFSVLVVFVCCFHGHSRL